MKSYHYITIIATLAFLPLFTHAMDNYPDSRIVKQHIRKCDKYLLHDYLRRHSRPTTADRASWICYAQGMLRGHTASRETAHSETWRYGSGCAVFAVVTVGAGIYTGKAFKKDQSKDCSHPWIGGGITLTSAACCGATGMASWQSRNQEKDHDAKARFYPDIIDYLSCLKTKDAGLNLPAQEDLANQTTEELQAKIIRLQELHAALEN